MRAPRVPEPTELASELPPPAREPAPGPTEAAHGSLPARAERASGLAELMAVDAATATEPQELLLAPPVLLEPAPEPAAAARPRLRARLSAILGARLSLAFLLQAFAAFAVVHFLLSNLSVVRGSSMNPGICDGDRILVDHLAYLFGEVQRGDVVVLKYPLDPSVDYIKRVIGLPGDDVTLAEGRVWVNGVELEEPYSTVPDHLAHFTVRVKPAHFFVLGDNRPRSSDSRDFGLVPRDYVRGRVEVRLWPIARIGAID